MTFVEEKAAIEVRLTPRQELVIAAFELIRSPALGNQGGICREDNPLFKVDGLVRQLVQSNCWNKVCSKIPLEQERERQRDRERQRESDSRAMRRIGPDLGGLHKSSSKMRRPKCVSFFHRANFQIQSPPTVCLCRLQLRPR
jgi:hypothetical protein